MGSSTSLARIGSFSSPYIIHLVSIGTKHTKENIFKTKETIICLFYEMAAVSKVFKLGIKRLLWFKYRFQTKDE